MLGSIAGALFQWLMGRIFKRDTGPTVEERAGKAEAEVRHLETNNAIENAASDARAAAERSLLDVDGGPGEVDNNPNSSINQSEYGYYRD